MSFVLAPPPVPSVAVVGDHRRFAVRRVFCVGRNYAAHAREMGASGREAPFFFSKPACAVVDAGIAVGSGAGCVLPFPKMTSELHHEVEVVVAVGAGGVVYGACVGVDLTRRDLQNEAKKLGRPWDMAKGFDRSAPLSPITPGVDVDDGALWLSVNGVEKQRGSRRDMIWRAAEILDQLKRFVDVDAGDLIFTGTPEGVGALVKGDVVDAGGDGLAPLRFTLAAS